MEACEQTLSFQTLGFGKEVEPTIGLGHLPAAQEGETELTR